MEKKGIAEERVSQPSNIYSETSVFDRIIFRLDGLNAMSTVAFCATDNDSPPTSKVWQPFFYALGLTMEDIKRDLYQLQQEHDERASA